MLYQNNNKGFATLFTSGGGVDDEYGCDGCCIGIRGNVDGDLGDSIDISDIVYYVDFSFNGSPAPISCP